MEKPKAKRNWKQWLLHELNEYIFNVIYLSIAFGTIILYRRLLLAEYGIQLNDYFIGVVKALVIGKVIMIGTFLTISRKFENRPLLIPVLYKALLFTLWVLLFDVAEEFIRGLIHTGNAAEAIETLKTHITIVWLGKAQVTFFLFIPFFAFKELSRTMGHKAISNLFLRTQATKQAKTHS